jgi:hypothetical protein
MVYDKKEGAKVKGAFDHMAWCDLNNKKEFNMPIIATAVYNYFTKDIPVETTIKSHKDLHDFCAAKKVGDTYDEVWFSQIVNFQKVTKIVQNVNRYYVTSDFEKGGSLFKVKKSGKKIRSEGISAENTVYLYNDVENQDNPPEPYYPYYVKEARKLISQVENFQISLFG